MHLFIFNIFIGALCFTVCSSYRRMFMEDDKLCSPITKRRLELEKGTKSALYIDQKRLRDHSIDWKSHFECKFEVKAPKHNGIMAVIQYLSLRRNRTTGDCSDYIQFKGHDGHMSRRHCDMFNAEYQMVRPPASHLLSNGNNYSINSFVEPKGIMDVRIFVSKYALTNSEDVDIRIVLTSYRVCNTKLENDVPCMENSNICIDKEFINDNVFNCPYYDCVDEGGCQPKLITTKKESLGNKVLIASLSSLLITFVLFICCLWICRVHKILCWAQTFANSPAQQTERTRNIELNEQTIYNRPAVVSTASAPLQVEEEDKDLPPSYESLFPSR